MEQLKMYIGGEWVNAESGKTFAAISPIDQQELALVPSAGAADVDKAVHAANDAFHIWFRKSQDERSAILCEIANAIRAHAPELARLEALEHGTPYKEALGITMGAAAKFENSAWLAKTVMGNQLPVPGNNTISYLQREPLGVVGLIVPWNLPTIMIAVKMAPALAMGNTCVLKPPSINSMIGLKFAEIISTVKSLPAGTVNVVTGSGSIVGNAMATHPLVDMIGFTGSSETGKDILAAASSTVKKCVMELGGNNPVIVMPDADLDEAMKVLGHRQFNNCGQHCSGLGRYYVHEDIHDEFVKRLAEVAESQVIGDPMKDDTTMGPVVSAAHKHTVEGYIAKGIEEGATLYYQKKPQPEHEKGFYVMPTILTDCSHNMTPVKEEIFGPVAAIIKYNDKDNLRFLANDSPYGLCAHIWTGDVAKGMELINDLNVGAVFINCQMLQENQPWGTSVKESGLGKEGAIMGLLEFTDQKLVCVKYKKD